MTVRNVEARILKLEARHRRPDEILLIWREPGVDVASAVAGAQFAKGDKAICAEWFGEKPLPAPRWYRRLDRHSLESGYVRRSLEHLVAARPEQTPSQDSPQLHLCDFSDNDLLHMALGVTHEEHCTYH